MFTPPQGPSSRLTRSKLGLLLMFVTCILTIFVIDRLVRTSVPESTTATTVLSRLHHRDVKRATIAATTITVELNDGTTLREPVPRDRDLWPALHQSGADISVVRAQTPRSTPLFASIFLFIPIGVMALLLLAILRRARYNPPTWPRQG